MTKMKTAKAFRRKVRPFERKQEKKIVNYHDPKDDDEESDGGNMRKQSNNERRARAEKLLKIRRTLPVFQNREQVMSQILSNPVTVLIGETGSGKSTQIPQFLVEALCHGKNSKSIAVTQPRRVAAINLATRVAEESGTQLGQEVGYSVRFDNKSHTTRTKLKYLTDGMLIRELMLDKNLTNYNCIIIDEAHERTILTDLILGFLKQLQEKRNDLKIVIMSATLQADLFSKFFNDAPVLFVEGRKFNVERFFVPNSCEDLVDSVIRCCVQLNSGELTGDILCFLPGQEEIDKAVQILNKISEHLDKSVPKLIAYPLYASLPPREQTRVFEPLKGFKRKVVLSTNIAETSVTIPGVKYVIDSGLRKVKVWRHQLGLATLLTVPISKASASQRTGRAGRESEGKCYRLYTENDYNKLPTQTESEIARCEISSPILMLKKIGVKDVVNWSWLEYPGKEAIIQAMKELYELGALNDAGKITDRGQKMALLPLAPHLSNVLIRAAETSVLSSVIDIVSCLSVENLILNPLPEERDEINEKRLALCTKGSKFGDLIMLKEFFDYYCDLSTPDERKNWCREVCVSYRGFKNVIKVREQLLSYMKKLFNITVDNESKTDGLSSEISNIIKCFLSSFVKNTAIGMPDRSYRTTTTGETISVHPSSMLFMNQNCPAILYIEYVFTTKGYARYVSRVDLGWLHDISSSVMKQHV